MVITSGVKGVLTGTTDGGYVAVSIRTSSLSCTCELVHRSVCKLRPRKTIEKKGAFQWPPANVCMNIPRYVHLCTHSQTLTWCSRSGDSGAVGARQVRGRKSLVLHLLLTCLLVWPRARGICFWSQLLLWETQQFKFYENESAAPLLCQALVQKLIPK